MRTKQKYLIDTTANHLSKKEQLKLGAFYTPPEIALKMARILDYKNDGDVLDPCCGKGNLHAAMLDTYLNLQEENIYGIDIDPEAIKFCIEYFPYGHFQVGDCLKDDFTNPDFWEKDPFETFIKYKMRTKIKAGGFFTK